MSTLFSAASLFLPSSPYPGIGSLKKYASIKDKNAKKNPTNIKNAPEKVILFRSSKGHTAAVMAVLVAAIACIGSKVASASSVRALKTPIIEFIQISKNAYRMKHIIYTILGLLAPTGLKK